MSTPESVENGTYQGRCVGGPMDGEIATCRYRAGFVLADKPAGRAWIYDRVGDGSFAVREPAGRGLDSRRATVAALGDDYDVIAAAWGGEPGGGA